MKSYYFLLFLLLLSSCRKDSEDRIINEPDFKPEIEIVDDFEPAVIPVTASVLGKVLNENGYPIADVLVTLGAETMMTNEKGIFIFQSIPMNAAGTFVRARKEEFGYLEGGSRFFPEENSENYVTIRLLSNVAQSSFSAAEGATINIEGGSKLEVNANSLLLPNGNVYEGEVSAYTRLLAPDKKHLLDFLPGNLQGYDRENKEVALTTFGLLAIELRSSNDEVLTLDKNKPAKLNYSIIDAQLDFAPAEITFWSFNTTYGLWQDRGDAFRKENRYVMDVTTLSFCHFAEASAMVNIQGRLENQEGFPVPNLLLQTNDFLTGESAYTYTDNKGFFSTYIPENRLTDIKLSSEGVDCIDWPFEIETYQEDKDFDDITLTGGGAAALVSLTGTLTTCTNELANDFFIAVNEGTNAYCFYQLDGNEMALSLPVCSADDELSVSVQDMADLHESGDLTLDADLSLDLGLLELCGDGEADFIIIKFPGEESIVFENPELVVIGDITHIVGYENATNQVDLSFNGMTAGTYTDEQINIFRGAFPSNSVTIEIECEMNCGFDQLIVEEYGLVPGEKVRGTFSGGSIFELSTGTPNNSGINIPFEGSFRITRQL